MTNKIPTYFAERPMERERLPRAPARQLADVGAGLEAEALGQFGAAMKDVSVDLLTKWRKRRTDAQLAEGDAAWERAHTDFFGRDTFTLNGKQYTGLATDQNLDGYEKKYKSFAKSLRRQILHKSKRLTSRAKHLLTNYITANQPKMEKEVAIALLYKQKDQGRATMLGAITDFERAGDTEAAHAAINSAQKNNYITAERAERLRQSVSTNVDWYRGLMQIDENPAEFLEALEGDADPGIDFKFLENLTPEQKLSLKSRAIRQQGTLLAQQRAVREQQINAEQGRLMNLARKGELTDDIIGTSALEVFGTGSKATFYSILDARAKAAIAKKEEPYLKSDPVVKARILDRIRDPKDKIIPADISDLVGKGLSVGDGDRLIARLDVFKGFWFGRADSYLKQNLGWNETYVKFLHPEGSLAYSLAMEELFTVIEKEGLKDDKELYDRARAIATPHLVDYWEKALSFSPEKIARLTRMLKIKPPTEKLTPEEELTYLRLSLPPDVDKSVQNLLDKGWSAQRVIDELIRPEKPKKQKTKKGTGLDPEGIFQ